MSDVEGPERWLHIQPTPAGHLPIIPCSCTHLDSNCVDLLHITPRHWAHGDKGMCILLPALELPALRPFPCTFPAWEVTHGGYGWLHLHRFHMQKPAFLAVQLWLEPRGVNGSAGGVWESGSTMCMEEAPETQPNCLEQEAPMPGTTRGVPWQQGRETSSGNGVTRLAPALLAGTKWSFSCPASCLRWLPPSPCAWMCPLSCPPQHWVRRAAGRSPGTKSLANSTLIAPTMPWLSLTCFQLQRWLPGTLQPILDPFLMLWS